MCNASFVVIRRGNNELWTDSPSNKLCFHNFNWMNIFYSLFPSSHLLDLSCVIFYIWEQKKIVTEGNSNQTFMLMRLSFHVEFWPQFSTEIYWNVLLLFRIRILFIMKRSQIWLIQKWRNIQVEDHFHHFNFGYVSFRFENAF